MKAITQYRYGGPELLSYREVDDPVAEEGEVLVRVRAAGLSPGDRAMVTGVPYVNRFAVGAPRRPKTPIPGYDVAGIVEAVGPGVTRFEPGDRVFGNAPGSFAELAVGREDQLIHKPGSWSFEEAAAVPESACVALQAVRDRGRVEAGHRVAVVGAGGGVGAYAVQLATALGATVTGVCGTRMVEGVLAIGATSVVDYRRQRLDRAGPGYDVIVDAAGRTPLRELRRALTHRGRLVLVGADHGRRLTGGLERWLRALVWSPFVPQELRPLVARPLDRDVLQYLADAMASGDLVPVVDRTFAIADAADAMRYLDHRARPGKVVLVI